MEAAEYEIMYRHEESHWWYVGLRDLVLGTLTRLARGRGDYRILDAGCGTGKVLDACGGYRAAGVELAPEAFPLLRRRGLADVVRGDVCRLPFADATFDAVVSLDVLYHITAPGDLAALREIARVLKPGGRAILNLPAYEFLRSQHDLAIHTKQRYTRGRVRELLAVAGLRAETLSYRNTLLFPAAAAVRLLQKLTRPNPSTAKSDLHLPPPWLNRLLTWPLLLENRLLRMGGRLPFGLSVFCVAARP